jgi:membrane-bound metal-dependent hydrolase YbcI (DUF457 family)
MEGHTHALTGFAAGGAAGLLVMHDNHAATLALAVMTAGFATVPDLDQKGSACARAAGPLSGSLAFLVHRMSGGHRHFTHTLACTMLFGALAWAGAQLRHDAAGRVVLAVALFLALAGGLNALRIGRPWHADVLAAAGAAAVAWLGWHLALVPVACSLGCLTHIAGDALTVEGVPFLWPVRGHQWLLPRFLRFETGHAAEHLIVTPAVLAAIAWLAWHAVTMPH